MTMARYMKPMMAVMMVGSEGEARLVRQQAPDSLQCQVAAQKALDADAGSTSFLSLASSQCCSGSTESTTTTPATTQSPPPQDLTCKDGKKLFPKAQVCSQAKYTNHGDLQEECGEGKCCFAPFSADVHAQNTWCHSMKHPGAVFSKDADPECAHLDPSSIHDPPVHAGKCCVTTVALAKDDGKLGNQWCNDMKHGTFFKLTNPLSSSNSFVQTGGTPSTCASFTGDVTGQVIFTSCCVMPAPADLASNIPNGNKWCNNVSVGTVFLASSTTGGVSCGTGTSAIDEAKNYAKDCCRTPEQLDKDAKDGHSWCTSMDDKTRTFFISHRIYDDVSTCGTIKNLDPATFYTCCAKSNRCSETTVQKDCGANFLVSEANTCSTALTGKKQCTDACCFKLPLKPEVANQFCSSAWSWIKKEFVLDKTYTTTTTASSGFLQTDDSHELVCQDAPDKKACCEIPQSCAAPSTTIECGDKFMFKHRPACAAVTYTTTSAHKCATACCFAHPPPGALKKHQPEGDAWCREIDATKPEWRYDNSHGGKSCGDVTFSIADYTGAYAKDCCAPTSCRGRGEDPPRISCATNMHLIQHAAACYQTAKRTTPTGDNCADDNICCFKDFVPQALQKSELDAFCNAMHTDNTYRGRDTLEFIPEDSSAPLGYKCNWSHVNSEHNGNDHHGGSWDFSNKCCGPHGHEGKKDINKANP